MADSSDDGGCGCIILIAIGLLIWSLWTWNKQHDDELSRLRNKLDEIERKEARP
jgi:hypothetical protein